MGARRIKVLVVDDHEVVRAGLTALLSRELDIHLVGALASAESAIEQLDILAPDVIVLDHRLGGMCGALACAQILERRPATAVLILTSTPDENVLLPSIRAGARGFLLKTSDPKELVDAIRKAAQHHPVIAPEALDVLLAWVHTTKDEESALSSDEIEVLQLAARGMKNAEIAQNLSVTEYAVKARLKSAKKKLCAQGRSEVVLAGIRRGVI